MSLPIRPSLIQVCDAVYGDHNTGRGLRGCFANSIDAYFDLSYKGAKDRLSNFSNYGPTFTFDPAGLSYYPNGNPISGNIIYVYSNATWTCDISAGWISLNKYGSTGNDNVTVSLTENLDGNGFAGSRTSGVNFYIGGVSQGSCIIYQYGTPKAPVATAASNIATDYFKALWDESQYLATGYRIDVATDSGFNNFVSGYNNADQGNNTNSDVYPLSPDTYYYYRIRAYNGIGTVSPNSNTIQVQTTP